MIIRKQIIDWFSHPLIHQCKSAPPVPAEDFFGVKHSAGGGVFHKSKESEPDKHLSDCRAGDEIFIRRLLGRGPLRKRLLEMGMNPGAQVRVVKYAPLKDPLECEVKGYHLALRVSEARAIIVTPQKP